MQEKLTCRAYWPAQARHSVSREIAVCAQRHIFGFIGLLPVLGIPDYAFNYFESRLE
jgi:hypothetical protein